MENGIAAETCWKTGCTWRGIPSPVIWPLLLITFVGLARFPLLTIGPFLFFLFLEEGLLWILKCLVNSSLLENLLVQPGNVQPCGFSPVWVLMCLVWCSRRWNALSQKVHLYGLSSFDFFSLWMVSTAGSLILIVWRCGLRSLGWKIEKLKIWAWKDSNLYGEDDVLVDYIELVV